jgi:hypothetical protein
MKAEHGFFQVEFATDNAAFEDGNFSREVVRILRGIADSVERGVIDGKVLDVNGKSVGEFGHDYE